MKVLIYDTGKTYEIDEKEIYNPFPACPSLSKLRELLGEKLEEKGQDNSRDLQWV